MPPLTFTLLEFDNIVEQFPGRGVVYGSAYWDGSGPLEMAHLGETEGVIRLTPNAAFASITMPEQRGDAPLRVWERGRAPTLELSVFLTDADARQFFSPRSSSSAGNKRWRPVLMKSLMIAPEDLMWDDDAGVYRTLTFSTEDGFLINEEEPNARQQALLDQVVFIWRVYFEAPPITFGVENDGRALEAITGRVAPDLSKPDGHELYTFGRDLAASGIDLEGEPEPET